MDKMSRSELLRQIQMLDFYAVELNLFLNTHPNNQQALQDYQYVVDQAAKLRQVYETRFGPLLNFQHGNVTQNRWNWIDEPWPWENMKGDKYVDL